VLCIITSYIDVVDEAGATLIRLRCDLRVGDGLRCCCTLSSSERSLPSEPASDSLPQPPAAAERVLPLALAARGAARREGREGLVLGTSICTGFTHNEHSHRRRCCQ
jgi:hypothetical protein